jgi:SseB protein C-terminal domain
MDNPDKSRTKVFPKGTKLLSGPAPRIPTKLLFALAALFEDLQCVSEAFIVQVKFERPDDVVEVPHLILQVRMNPAVSTSFADIVPQIGQTVEGNFGIPDTPVDFIEVGQDEATEHPLQGSQLFYKSVDGRMVPT